MVLVRSPAAAAAGARGRVSASRAGEVLRLRGGREVRGAGRAESQGGEGRQAVEAELEPAAGELVDDGGEREDPEGLAGLLVGAAARALRLGEEGGAAGTGGGGSAEGWVSCKRGARRRRAEVHPPQRMARSGARAGRSVAAPLREAAGAPKHLLLNVFVVAYGRLSGRDEQLFVDLASQTRRISVQTVCRRLRRSTNATKRKAGTKSLLV